mmetsp:Transcript_49407/g.142074  ORF Transcript_49407/g.142074 Transcript_49407/m.142074 type:complete len:220 (-) Transcript_49407:373-1032(-)
MVRRRRWRRNAPLTGGRLPQEGTGCESSNESAPPDLLRSRRHVPAAPRFVTRDYSSGNAVHMLRHSLEEAKNCVTKPTRVTELAAAPGMLVRHLGPNCRSNGTRPLLRVHKIDWETKPAAQPASSKMSVVAFPPTPWSTKAAFATSMVVISMAMVGTALFTAPASPATQAAPGAREAAALTTCIVPTAIAEATPAEANLAGTDTLSRSPPSDEAFKRLT